MKPIEWFLYIVAVINSMIIASYAGAVRIDFYSVMPILLSATLAAVVVARPGHSSFGHLMIILCMDALVITLSAIDPLFGLLGMAVGLIALIDQVRKRLRRMQATRPLYAEVEKILGDPEGLD